MVESASYDGAKAFCTKYHRSSMFSPKDSEENKELHDIALPHHDSCKASYYPQSLSWIGMDFIASKWIHTSNKKQLTYTNFLTEARTRATPYYQCLSIKGKVQYWSKETPLHIDFDTDELMKITKFHK